MAMKRCCLGVLAGIGVQRGSNHLHMPIGSMGPATMVHVPLRHMEQTAQCLSGVPPSLS